MRNNVGEVGREKDSQVLLEGREIKTATVEKSMDSFKKTKTRMPCVPAVPPPGLPLTSQRQVCIPGVM